MSSPVVVSNMALSHLGSDKTIAQLTESSTEAKVMNLFYETALKEAFRDMQPDFATKKHVTLSKLGSDPNDAWGYYYRYPTDCLYMVKLWSGIRRETTTSKIAYELGYDADGTVLYCDLDSAKANYIVKVDNVERYPADFLLAFSYRLAWYASPRIDRLKNADRVLGLYTAMTDKSMANSANEEQPDFPSHGDLVEARL